MGPSPYVCIHVLCKVFLIDIRPRRIILQTESCVADLYWQSKFEIQQASLTNVLDFGAGLANLCLLEAHAYSWAPSKDCKGSGADFTFLGLRLLGLLGTSKEYEGRLESPGPDDPSWKTAARLASWKVQHVIDRLPCADMGYRRGKSRREWETPKRFVKRNRMINSMAVIKSPCYALL